MGPAGVAGRAVLIPLFLELRNAFHVVVGCARRLGQLITQEEDEIGLIPSWPRTLRWCGVASAGAELRIDGPKPPASA